MGTCDPYTTTYQEIKLLVHVEPLFTLLYTVLLYSLHVYVVHFCLCRFEK